MVIIGSVFVVVLLIAAHLIEANYHLLSFYLEDVAGAVTTILISVLTYDEWERRRERKRYRPSEKMGITRIRDEMFQLLYQYAFVLNLRWDKNSDAVRTVEEVTADKDFAKHAPELHAKTAKHISQEDPRLKNNLFTVSRKALASPELSKQTYRDINELISQTESAIREIDLTIATYGYSFTPEVHKWALDVRESLSQSITGQMPLLAIRLCAVSKVVDNKIKKSDRAGVEELIKKLVKVGSMTTRQGSA